MNLQAYHFITPLIVLLLTIGGYYYFNQRINNTGYYHRYLIVTGIVSFVFNWIWEVVHGPLYQDFEYDLVHIGICGLASVADMLMVYLLLFGFGLIYRNVYWIRKLSASHIFWLIVAGFLGANLSEWRHIWTGSWAYTDAMPLVPVINTGLSPVMQFTFLPLFIFWLVTIYMSGYNKN